MQERALEPINEDEINCNFNGERSLMVPWSLETNWVVTHGSLENSVTVESSDYPIKESDLDNSAQGSPLLLKPRRCDSSPCEIKVSFGKKFDIGQVYVRSTARVYELYYASTAQSFNEYLCTVRCGPAERDEKLLRTAGIECEAEEHGVGKLHEDSISIDDDWVKIKVPKGGKSFASSETETNRVRNMQDLYEATAQIRDADPCSFLTIRFLSLQNKSHVYVDEVYVFADPVELPDSGVEAVPTASVTGSSLMAMLVPTLLQSVRSGFGPEKVTPHAPDEVLRRFNEIGSGSAKNPRDEELDAAKSIGSQQSSVAPMTVKSVQSVNIDGSCVTQAESQVDQQSVKLQNLDENTTESAESQKLTSALHAEPTVSDLLVGRVERALEHLITRVSRVEDICSRFEEKLLKPIESIESRIQSLEHQLETLTKNSLHTEFPGCTRLSAPAFSLSESNSSSFYNERSDCPPLAVSNFEKEKELCDNTSHCANDEKYRPILVVSAPAFSWGEEEESKSLKDTPCSKPKQTLSVDDALAAALSGFMSDTKTNFSDHQTTPGLFSAMGEKILNCDGAEPCQITAHGFPTTENVGNISSQFTRVLSVVAPDFTVDEIGEEEYLKCACSSSVMASVFKSVEKENVDEMIPPDINIKNLSTSADSCELNGNEAACEIRSATSCSSPVVSNSLRTCGVNVDMIGHPDKFGLNKADSSIEGDISGNFVEASDLTATTNYQIDNETDTGIESCVITLDNDIVVKQVVAPAVPEKYIPVERWSKDDSSIPVSESSHAGMVDFEFPILEVKFISDDDNISVKSPLEALFVGVSESNTEAYSIHNTVVDDDDNPAQTNVDIIEGNETADLFPSNLVLVDVEAYTAVSSPSSESVPNLYSSLCPEMIVSLI